MSKLLWKPSASRAESTQLHHFLALQRQAGVPVADYESLHAWSVAQPAEFWAALWSFAEIRHSTGYDAVVDDPIRMPGARWFSGAKLNFAENLLRYRDAQDALVFYGEGQSEPERLSYANLYRAVARAARALRELGIQPGDRIAAFMPNRPETVIAMLAATSVGAIWSSCSPDFGRQGVLDRFGQIEPRVLFTADGYFYNGKPHDSRDTATEVVRRLGSIERLVVVPYVEAQPQLPDVPGAVLWDDFLGPDNEPELSFEQLPPDHPIYIMYSSGTTGVPKCIVHGAAGTLVQHFKEFMLHVDLRREDRIVYFTTCGWMMWNWLVSALGIGATVVLYDGSPFYPDGNALFDLADRERISVFGTSAKFIAAAEKAGIKPRETHGLEALKTILSTGSPLSPEGFEYVYRDVKADVCLSSISGGTDIISCFAGGNPLGPVHAGELQCRGLGMRVEAFNERGESLVGEKGELVCTLAAPSMPVGFWADPDGSKYRRAYFERFPGIWHHGDYIEITETGGVVVYGRSDATLNPGGVRIGTAEIYRQVDTLDEIEDSLVVGQDFEGDVRVVLFVKLRAGQVLDDALIARIKSSVRKHATPRHVPAKVLQVADIPYTISGKKVELAVRQILAGEAVQNRDALANPEALDLYRDLAELRH